MKILQIGYPKSGSYWLWKILDSILRCASLERKSFIQTHPFYPTFKTWELSFPEQAGIDFIEIRPGGLFYNVIPFLRLPIENLSEYLDKTTHVWTHSSFNPGSVEVFSQFEKIVCIIRDPRDSAVSFANFAWTPFMLKFAEGKPQDRQRFLKNGLRGYLNGWVNHTGSYLLMKNIFRIHIVFYERLLDAFDEELDKILCYLGVPLPLETKRLVKQEACFDRMKAASPHHVARGRAGRWHDELTAIQKREAVKVAGPMLQLLGYPVGGKKRDGALPFIAPHLRTAQIQQAMKFACGSKPLHPKEFSGAKRDFHFINSLPGGHDRNP